MFRGNMPSAQSKYWVFTINNPSDALHLDPATFSYCVYQEEVGESGTHHFQGYIEFPARVTMLAAKAALGEVGASAHLERRLGTAEEARDYCMKTESRVAEPIEIGEISVPHAGDRSDLKDLVAFIAAGHSKLDVYDTFPEVLAKYPRFVDTAFAYERQRLVEKIDIVLRPWQQRIVDLVDVEPVSDRQILWVYDLDGGKGKSVLAKWLMQERGAYYCNGGKHTDIAHSYVGEPVAIFDYVRDSKEYVNYGVMEALKNGVIFSPKYESGTKRFNVPVVLVFANFEPDGSKFSQDRLKIIDLGVPLGPIVQAFM